ncbi:retrovirus-related Pol polyprotein from transposon opus [Trichonephila clavipes]|nr:retrovirus-related Pol polyprotein from transposon opus [Trichonephila clavipes]
MNDVGAVKIPAYNFHDPALWFTMCDSTFQLGCPKAITDSKTKFNYIIAHLPPEAATIIRDVIMNPDPVEPYEKARTELIKRSGESSHQEIRKLLIGEELGDKRPSELLRVMRRRAESHSVPDDLMLELFQQHLPTRVQSILAAISPLTLGESCRSSRSSHGGDANCAAQKCHPPCKFSKTSPVRYNGDYCLAKKFSSPFIRDRRTNVTFLIDTGSDVSIIPATKTQRQNNSQMTLSAANTSPIHVYTTQTLSLDLGLRRIFQWTFLVGNVSTPIIGADFLYNFRLVPDISKQALLDSETNIKCHCILGNSRIHSIKTVSGDSVYHELLRKFPDITKPPRPDQEIKHSVVHYIETNSRPVTAKARRLAPDRLRIAKAEFENMITLGHMRPSKSNYASPLHMVPKKDSTEWDRTRDQSAITVHSMLKLLKIIIAFPIF